jgi:hypothetical protein
LAASHELFDPGAPFLTETLVAGYTLYCKHRWRCPETTLQRIRPFARHAFAARLQIPVRPLTTAISSREYLASGTFTGLLIVPEEPRGVLEVGYEIGCGIDMSTSNGVTMAGSAGITPSLGVSGPLGALPTAVLPVLSTPINGVITVGLKPGLVIVVPVDKKEFKSPDPWVMISNFQQRSTDAWASHSSARMRR